MWWHPLPQNGHMIVVRGRSYHPLFTYRLPPLWLIQVVLVNPRASDILVASSGTPCRRPFAGRNSGGQAVLIIQLTRESRPDHLSPVIHMLDHLTTRLPPRVARAGKRTWAPFRYMLQRRACRSGFKSFGDRYPRHLLFIAGLPKSGTTWLKKMVACHPGFHELLPLAVTRYEMLTGRSHDYDLPRGMFHQLGGMLAVIKMHVHGSPNNLAVLRDAGVRHIVLHRDLRDVAISHVSYVKRAPWHPEHLIYLRRNTEEALRLFADRTLLEFAEWVRSWHDNGDPELSLTVRYENMVGNPRNVLTAVSRHFMLDSSPELIDEIIRKNSFETLSKGRMRGKEQPRSFLRKGVVGDWKSHFTTELSDLFQEKIAAFPNELGLIDGLVSETDAS